ncbi:MAG: hypothetical protein R3C16_06765 [Hyphomonadaceae bacterium]
MADLEAKGDGKGGLVREVVDDEAIAAVVSRWTACRWRRCSKASAPSCWRWKISCASA